MKRFKKGSEAAKRYMAKIRGMRKRSHVSRSRAISPRHTTKRRSFSMARRRYFRSRTRRGGGKSMMPKVFKMVRVGSLLANPVRIAMMPGAPATKVTYALQDFTGYNIQDGSFDASRMARGWGPYLMACVATYGIPKLTSLIRRL